VCLVTVTSSARVREAANSVQLCCSACSTHLGCMSLFPEAAARGNALGRSSVSSVWRGARARAKEKARARSLLPGTLTVPPLPRAEKQRPVASIASSLYCARPSANEVRLRAA
jgi:hypothetical protein